MSDSPKKIVIRKIPPRQRIGQRFCVTVGDEIRKPFYLAQEAKRYARIRAKAGGFVVEDRTK